MLTDFHTIDWDFVKTTIKDNFLQNLPSKYIKLNIKDTKYVLEIEDAEVRQNWNRSLQIHLRTSGLVFTKGSVQGIREISSGIYTANLISKEIFITKNADAQKNYEIENLKSGVFLTKNEFYSLNPFMTETYRGLSKKRTLINRQIDSFLSTYESLI